MRRTFFISFIVMVCLVLNGCSDNTVKKIKADYFDIGLGQSFYNGYNKVEEETVQSLVGAYNQIKYTGQTNLQINYDKAITITFVYNDQISGVLVIDNKGVFHLRDGVEIYQIEPSDDMYEQALEVYNDLKRQNENSLDKQ
ncbi:hypothetical protein BKP37_17135 [Anaerobacillus alkalilacustris]|uniref:Uncharacterized protein n=1 Tax=Anaerobacillus alkalilacustris TaxID=393763 RepID=A0A1S2LEC8_9BACI|nr:hypothetical protein [Anaerobacillus alkalilacustris]OIJ10858.1 hypothetical protein BKP37_17135 [Anaerobacillus alkalilacustris]